MKKLSLILLVLGVFLYSCKKENSSHYYGSSIIQLDWKSPDCPGDFESNPSYIGEAIHLENQFFSPAFNPNNPYEFCFYQIVIDSGSLEPIDHQIVTFNLQTGIKIIIKNNTRVSGNLAWNKQGWIAYLNYDDAAIHAINVNSNETKQLPITEGFLVDKNLAWLNGSDSLIWGGSDVNATSYLKLKIIDSNEEEEILIYGAPAVIHNEFTISSKNELLARGQGSMNAGNEFYKVHFNEIQEPWENFTIPLNGTKFGRVNWHADGNRFYVPMMGSIETAGLFEVNYSTLEIRKLYDFCEKQFIYQAVCSPNGKYLLLQKIERSEIVDEEGSNNPIIDYDKVIENNKLWLYDLSTNKETPLPLD